MRPPKRIKALADNTLGGHRGDAHQEFRAVVAANGFTMSRGGWGKDANGDNVCRGWETFAYMVTHTNEITLSEPQAIVELEDVEEAEAEEMEEDARRLAPVIQLPVREAEPAAEEMEEDARRLAPVIQLPVREAEPEAADAPPVTITYLYTTRSETISLTDRTAVETVIHEVVTGLEEGACQSGASLA